MFGHCSILVPKMSSSLLYSAWKAAGEWISECEARSDCNANSLPEPALVTTPVKKVELKWKCKHKVGNICIKTPCCKWKATFYSTANVVPHFFMHSAQAVKIWCYVHVASLASLTVAWSDVLNSQLFMQRYNPTWHDLWPLITCSCYVRKCFSLCI